VRAHTHTHTHVHIYDRESLELLNIVEVSHIIYKYKYININK